MLFRLIFLLIFYLDQSRGRDVGVTGNFTTQRWDVMSDFLVISTTKSLIMLHPYVVKLLVSPTSSPGIDPNKKMSQNKNLVKKRFLTLKTVSRIFKNKI